MDSKDVKESPDSTTKSSFLSKWFDPETVVAVDETAIAGDLSKYDEKLEWTEDEEKKLLWKIDFRVMSWVCLMFFFLQLDRGNIGNANSDGIVTDLGMTQDDYNTGTTLFYLGFVLYEIPSNMVIKVVGASRYIPFMMLLWGTITIFQSLIKDKTGFFLTRFFLGVSEAGYIPGIIFYLTQYYKTGELATRLSFFWGVLSFANSFSGLLAFAILRLRGTNGLFGWQWMWIIEGAATVFVALFSFFYLPQGPTYTKGLLRGPNGWFTDREERIAVTRVIRDDPGKKTGKKVPVKLKELIGAFTDSRLWMHLAIGFVGLMIPQPLSNYFPTIIKSLGFSTVISNLLTVPASLGNMITQIILATSSDKFKERTFHCLFGSVWVLAGLLLANLLPESAGTWAYYGALFFVVAWPYWHPINAAWISANMGSPGKRTIALALYIISVNINNFASSRIYAADDAPRYHRGNWILTGLAILTILLFLFARWRYIRLNNQRDRIWNAMSTEEKEKYLATTTDEGNDRLDFRFVY